MEKTYIVVIEWPGESSIIATDENGIELTFTDLFAAEAYKDELNFGVVYEKIS